MLNKTVKKQIEIIENFYNDLQKNKPYSDLMAVRGKHTRHGLGEIKANEAYAMQDHLREAIRYFDGWETIESHGNYEILTKDGVKVKYTWDVPVNIEYAPDITKHDTWEREKFEIVADEV